MQKKNTKKLKLQNFNLCPNILHVEVDADVDTGGIAIALLHQRSVPLNKAS